MKRSRISQKLEGVRKVLKSNDTAVVGLGEESKVHEVETSRIVSSEASHYILVKGADIVDSQSSQDEEEEKEEESDLQIRQTSQTTCSSLDVGPSTSIASFPGSIPMSGDVESGIYVHVGPDGACPTASREEIEHEVRKFFRDKKESLVVEDDAGSKPSSKIGLVGGEKHSATARGGTYDTVVLESESGGEKETVQTHEQGNVQENVIGEEGTSEVATNDDRISVVDRSIGGGPSSSQLRETLAGGAAVTGDSEAVHALSQSSRDSVTKGQREPSILATTKPSKDIHVLPPQSTSNLATSSVAKEEKKHNLLSYDTNTKENTKASSPSIVAIDLTTTHTIQGEPKFLQVSPQKQTTAESVEHDLLHSTESSAAAIEIGLIESDDGGSPFPPAAATEGVELIKSDDGGSPSPSAAAVAGAESDDGGSPSPRAAEWTGGEEVESLLTVAPSEAQKQLSLDVEQLEKEQTRQSRAAASVSNQMYKEAQVHSCTYCSLLGKRPLPGERPCTSLQGINIAVFSTNVWKLCPRQAPMWAKIVIHV